MDIKNKTKQRQKVISSRQCKHAHIFNQNTFLKQNILTDNALKNKTKQNYYYNFRRRGRKAKPNTHDMNENVSTCSSWRSFCFCFFCLFFIHTFRKRTEGERDLPPPPPHPSKGGEGVPCTPQGVPLELEAHHLWFRSDKLISSVLYFIDWWLDHDDWNLIPKFM